MIQQRKEEREKELALYNATKEGTAIKTEQIAKVLVEGSKNDLHSQFLAMEQQIKTGGPAKMQQQQPAMAQQQQVQNNTQSSASSAFDLMDIKAVNIN